MIIEKRKRVICDRNCGTSEFLAEIGHIRIIFERCRIELFDQPFLIGNLGNRKVVDHRIRLGRGFLGTHVAERSRCILHTVISDLDVGMFLLERFDNGLDVIVLECAAITHHGDFRSTGGENCHCRNTER